MYGQYKEKFLQNERRTTQLECHTLFDHTEEYEIKLGMDLCEMDDKDLFRTIQSISTNVATLRKNIRYIKRYLSWCVDNNLATINCLDIGMPMDFLVGYVGLNDLSYLTPERLKEKCSQLTSGTNDVLYETLLRCIYEGLEDNDLMNLVKLRSSDIQNHRIRITNGKVLTISSRLEALIIECSKLKSFNASLKENKMRCMTFKTFTYPDIVFKGINVSTEDWLNQTRKFRRWIDHIQFLFDEEITFEKVRDSGLFARMVDISIKRGVDLFEDLISEGSLTTTGENKDIVYGEMLLELRSSMNWKEFSKRFVMWSKFLEK